MGPPSSHLCGSLPLQGRGPISSEDDVLGSKGNGKGKRDGFNPPIEPETIDRISNLGSVRVKTEAKQRRCHPIHAVAFELSDNGVLGSQNVARS